MGPQDILVENGGSLLVENWGCVGNLGEPNIVAESIERDGKLYIEGTFMQAEVINGNKRLYPKKVLQEAVAKYIKEQVNTKQALGELNHPARANVDPLHAAIIIEKLEMRGNDVWGRARIIEGDFAEGDKTAALIRAGWIPGVSSRGLGSVKANAYGINEVQEGFRLTVGVDVVWGPSAPNAYVKPVVESVSVQPEEKKIDNNTSFLALAEALKNLN
ncbi:prohead core scaffold protein and protease [Aeromonas phage AsFcp_4]|uniref:Gp21 prohead core scaffold protein and protease n=1 Tax=Aeromonas phage PX29 TaxID=926067 RepID=E5DQF1_9CAUD|nr:gp21 prohead core scaffold protein and protease [Aeromonas phage PX29]ADQ52937.1 gp21 prohead core scaffold protein and protease [Aeromonas phage PX29]QAX98475.1 prohead core scaffold protein and protease [Aeromonas phage AsFcp_2]QAX99507.1 prohead core scaffold protein and protease [Aeromonas phage AsFcp_4]